MPNATASGARLFLCFGRVPVFTMAATDAQLKASTHALSKTWAVARQHKACFTGGKLQVAGAGLVAAQCNDGVTLMSLDTGLVSKIVQHAVSVRCCCCRAFPHVVLMCLICCHSLNTAK